MEELDLPVVSIIIPCYNAANYIGDSIQSALDQTYANCEVIVVDDGSRDASLDLIKDFADRICIEHGANRGACAARNRGLALSHGQFVKFLDADDLIDRDTVSCQVAASSGLSATVAYGPWKWLRASSGETEIADSTSQILPGEDLLTQWLSDRYCTPASLLWSREVLKKVGNWDESLTANQDGDLFIRAVLAGARFVPVADGTAYYRIDDSNSQSVGSRRTLDSLLSRIKVLDKLQTALMERGEFQRYRGALGVAYCYLARVYVSLGANEVSECFKRGLGLTEGAIPGSKLHAALVRTFGLRGKQRVSSMWHSLRRRLKCLDSQ